MEFPRDSGDAGLIGGLFRREVQEGRQGAGLVGTIWQDEMPPDACFKADRDTGGYWMMPFSI